MNLGVENRWNAYLQVRTIILATSILGLSSLGALAGSVGFVASKSIQGDAGWQRIHTRDEEFSIMMPTRLPPVKVSELLLTMYLGIS